MDQQEQMDLSLVEDRQVMKEKSSNSQKISPVILVHFNLNGLFQEDRYINVQI